MADVWGFHLSTETTQMTELEGLTKSKMKVRGKGEEGTWWEREGEMIRTTIHISEWIQNTISFWPHL